MLGSSRIRNELRRGYNREHVVSPDGPSGYCFYFRSPNNNNSNNAQNVNNDGNVNNNNVNNTNNGIRPDLPNAKDE